MYEAAQSEPRKSRINATRVVALFVVAALGLVFFQLFDYYWKQWTKDHSPFGFGYLVPPTVLYLLWCKRKSIASAEVRAGSPWVLPLILFAVFVQMVGILSAVNFIQSFAFIILLLAVPYYLWGPHVFAKIWGPVAFTLTMIPWPDQITAVFLLPSQLLSTKFAGLMLDLCGLAPTIDYTMVRLPNYKFEVAKACSGLTILFPVIAIAILNCMMVKASAWRKVTLLLLAVPISMLANSLRIAIIGLIGNAGGAALAQRLHDSSGLFGVFLAVILLSVAQGVLGCLHYHPEYMPSFAREDEPAVAEGKDKEDGE